MRSVPERLHRTERSEADGPAGIAAGSVVLTMEGQLPVEFLGPGDRIVTRGRGSAPLRGLRIIDATRSAFVTIPARALGRGLPQRDLDLHPAQFVVAHGRTARMFYGCSDAAIRADRMTTRRGRRQSWRFQLVFDTPQTIFVEGVELVMPGLC